MPTMPKTVNLKSNVNSADVINAVRNSNGYLKATLPEAIYGNTMNLYELGEKIMEDSSIADGFWNALVGRICKVILITRSYRNPYRRWKKGIIDFGETIEEIYVGLVESYDFDSTDDFHFAKQQIPDIKTAFHSVNYRKTYGTTTNEDKLRRAFTDWDSLTALIDDIIEKIYTSAEYDEQLMFQYLLGRTALDGRIYPITIGEINQDTIKQVTAEIGEISTNMRFMSTKYSYEEVPTFTPFENQILVSTARFNSIMTVEVLASLFHSDKIKFPEQRITIDKFSNMDRRRLVKLLNVQNEDAVFTEDEVKALDKIPAFILDEGFFLIYDYIYKVGSFYNPEKIYLNTFLNNWKLMATSPFVNAVVLTEQENKVTGITISPNAVTITRGQSAQLTATVTASGFAKHSVKWSIEGGTDSTISDTGMITVGNDETVDSLTVSATSTVDPSVTSTATITII